MMNVDKKNGNVGFSEKEHKYFDLNNPEKNYISVTTLIGRYEQPFDQDFWSAYKALEKLIPKEGWQIEKKSLLNSKVFNKDILGIYNISELEFNKAQQDILDSWEKKKRESCERGTKIHAELENSFYNLGKNVTLQKFGIGGKFECRKNYSDLDLENGVYPEYLIYRESEDGILRLAGQIDLVIKQGNDIICVDHKGLPLDTPILTSTGFKTMKDIQVGDKVFDKEGNLCNVTVKSAVHYNPCYRINFTKNFSITSDKDHRWLVYFKTHINSKYKGKDREEVMTTKEIYELFKTLTPVQLKNGYNTPKIKLCKPLNNQSRNLPLDPYILGLWLGDGTSSNGKITQELNSKAWNIIEEKGFKVSHNQEYRENIKAETRNIYGLMTILREIGVLNNKHIPDEYLLASYEQRLDLLRGLMDADGYYDHVSKTYIMRTYYKWQAEGMIKLVSSLGVKCTLNIVRASSSKKPNAIAYDIKFKTTQFNAFLCRNQNIVLKNRNDNYWSIRSVDEVEIVPTQCIAVDSPSHTYLCTEHLLITHNTNEEIKTKGIYNKATKGTYNMKYPLNHLPDINFTHYSLQLSTYAWMLQKLNPNFNIKDLIINHYDHNGNNTLYHCDYLKDDVERMLYHYKKQIILENQRAKRKRIEY